MRITEFLDQAGVRYDLRRHTPVFTSQGLAQREHERGRYVAKPVIVKADGRYVMCVLPAPRKVDLAKLKDPLGAETVALADEDQIGKLFPDCELGAEPPFGKQRQEPWQKGPDSLFLNICRDGYFHCLAKNITISN